MTKAEALGEAEVECLGRGTCSYPDTQGLEGAKPAVVLVVAREKSLLFRFSALRACCEPGAVGWRPTDLKFT